MGAGAFKKYRAGFQLIDQQPVRLDGTLTTTSKPTNENVVLRGRWVPGWASRERRQADTLGRPRV